MTNNLATLAIAQMNSGDNIEANLAVAQALANQAQQKGAQLLVLPENVACFGQNTQRATAERFDELKSAFSNMAQQHNLWLVAGTLPCPYRPNGKKVAHGRVRSACLVFDPSGDCVARYDKIHLFDAQVADNTGSYKESSTFEAGDTLSVANTQFGKLGLMVCYDLRFASMAIGLRNQAADILAVPAAFTYATGQAHWHLLLRARALDSQCLTLGSAQAGHHGDRRTFGSSGAADAWGSTIYQTPNETNQIGIVQFNQLQQNQIRLNLNIHMHRKFLPQATA